MCTTVIGRKKEEVWMCKSEWDGRKLCGGDESGRMKGVFVSEGGFIIENSEKKVKGNGCENLGKNKGRRG